MRERIDFSLSVSLEDIQNNARSKIGFVTGLLPSQITEDMVHTMIQPEMVSDDESLTAFLKLVQMNPNRKLVSQERLTAIAKRTTLQQLYETLVEIPFEPHHISYGINIPSFLDSLLQYKDLQSEQTKRHTLPHISLLIGAHAPSSVIEFATATRHVFPQAKLHLIDLYNYGAREACLANHIQFHRKNALAMPFPENTFNSIQTGMVLDLLEPGKTNAKTYEEKAFLFFQEAYRTLKPGGILVAVEAQLPRRDEQMLLDMGADPSYLEQLGKENKERIQDLLLTAGFKGIRITHALAFRSRQYLDQYFMLGNQFPLTKELAQNVIEERAHRICVTALKLDPIG